MTDLRVNACPQCSAPLQVGPYDLDVTCRYCGISVHVRDPAPPPPPPPVSRFGAPDRPNIVIVMGPGGDPDDHHFVHAAHATNTASWVVWGVVTAVILLTAVPGALIGSGVFSRKTSLPATCGVNGIVVVDGKDVLGAHDALVHAGVNCQITLKHVNAKTDGAIIEGGPNLKIVIEDSDLEAGGAGLDVGTNATITLRRTKIRAKDDGVKAEMNLDLTCDSCSITSQGTAITGGMNAKVKLSNQAEVKGATDGVDVGLSGSLDAQNSRVTGGTVGLHGSSSSMTVRLRQGAVVSGATAVHGGSNLKMRLEGGAIEGKEIGLEADSVDFDAQDGTLTGTKAALSLSRAPSTSARSSFDKLKLNGPLLVGGVADAEKPSTAASAAGTARSKPASSKPAASSSGKKPR